LKVRVVVLVTKKCNANLNIDERQRYLYMILNGLYCCLIKLDVKLNQMKLNGISFILW